MDNNFIPEKCGPFFVEALKPNQTIVSLTLSGTLLSRQVQADLNSICIRNRRQKKNQAPERMRDESAHLLRDLGHLPEIMKDYRRTERKTIRVNKEIEKVEKQIQEVKNNSETMTTQLKQQLAEQQKQMAKKKAEKEEKDREYKEVSEMNAKQQRELNASLEEETAAYNKETQERWVMAMEDIRSLYFTYEVEKERHDKIIEKNDAEIAVYLRKGKYAAASIEARGGKVVPKKTAPKPASKAATNRPLPK